MSNDETCPVNLLAGEAGRIAWGIGTAQVPLGGPSRRDLVSGAMATLLSVAGISVRARTLPVCESRPIVGAIRWDAWYDPSSVTGQAVESSLGPQGYHFRLPFFARVIGKNRVNIDGGFQKIMDKEIHLARHAGLNYWAFLGYEQGSPMDKAFSLYLSSSQNHQLLFCLISELARWGGGQQVSPMVERHRKLMLSPNYQLVLNGRPLYFIMAVDESRLQQDWGGAEGFRSELDFLRTWLQSHGRADPYIVIMDDNEKKAASLALRLGADAISTYAYAPQRVKGTFAELSAAVTSFWNREAGTGVAVVPTVVSGWDRRPRIDHPVPWEQDQNPGKSQFYYETGSANEIAKQLKDCIRWVKQHPIECPAQGIIIYAWNENDEGGWLIPTFPGNASRLNAVRRVLSGGP